MTKTKIAEYPNEDRGKIGPWDRFEIAQLEHTFRDLVTGCKNLLAANEAGDQVHQEILVGEMAAALFEVTKFLAGSVVAHDPQVAGELAKSFLVLWGASGTREETSTQSAAQWEPVRVSVLSTETRKHERTEHTVDVALLRVAYYDAETSGEVPTLVDALLVRRDRTNDDRRVRYFPSEVNSQHFDRAVECRAQWLGVSDGPFAADRPCT